MAGTGGDLNNPLCGFRERLEVIKAWKDKHHVCPFERDEPCYFCEAVELFEKVLIWPPQVTEAQCSKCGCYVCPGCGRGDC
jgi:hypothetical protein